MKGDGGSAGVRPRRLRKSWLALAAVLMSAVLTALIARVEYAYVPSRSAVFPDPSTSDQYLGPDDRGVSLAEKGRRNFYILTRSDAHRAFEELDLLSGAVTPLDLARALIELGGSGTENLRITLSRSAEIAGQVYPAGMIIDTGLDVPREAYLPLGIRLTYDRGRLGAQLTCAACHAQYDVGSGQIFEGVGNQNLNAGMMLALADGSAALLGAVDVDWQQVARQYGKVMRASTAPRVLEDAIDEILLTWPPGSMATLPDLLAAPVRVPSLFSLSPAASDVRSAHASQSDEVGALTAYRQRLSPPPPLSVAAERVRLRGREVFRAAGCAACHGVPDDGHTQMAVLRPPAPPLLGLYWSAPYLHDGGIAAGIDIDTEAGFGATLLTGAHADPVNSLRALLDRELRAVVVSANSAFPTLRRARIRGTGHPHWVDSGSGFSRDEQQALIDYLLWPHNLPQETPLTTATATVD